MNKSNQSAPKTVSQAMSVTVSSWIQKLAQLPTYDFCVHKSNLLTKLQNTVSKKEINACFEKETDVDVFFNSYFTYASGL